MVVMAFGLKNRMTTMYKVWRRMQSFDTTPASDRQMDRLINNPVQYR